MTPARKAQRHGIAAAFLSAIFLGTAPIFGKQAYAFGMEPLALAAWRTVFAASGLWLIYGALGRKYLFIYPAGLIGCIAVGAVNGIGSLLYYTGLHRVDAGVGQMVYSLYPLFLVVFLRLDGHRFSALTMFRMLLALLAVAFLSQTGDGPVDAIGLGLMVGAGLLYALHLALSQRVSYEMPAQTLTLYSLTAMAAVVSVAYLLSASVSAGAPQATQAIPFLYVPAAAWGPTAGLAFVTLVSRLGMFVGVKRLGSLQTALIGITEILVTLLLALTLLGEALDPKQWIGAVLLMGSLLLIGREPALGLPLRRKSKAAKNVTTSSPTIVTNLKSVR
jgi:drug/metabolite transporter (DMT)-like permease